MKPMSWPMFGVTALLLTGAGFFAGRWSRPADTLTASRPIPQLGGASDQANSSPGIATTASPLPSAEKDDRSRISGLRADLHKNSADPVERLNELQALLNTALKNNTLSPLEVVAMFKDETDPSILDILQGVLAANPDYANQPGVTAAFTNMALADPNASRRQTAVAYLGTVWDQDGKVKDVLMTIAQGEEDIGLRMCALGTLKAYMIKNWPQADSVSHALLIIAQKDQNADVRAQAVNSLEIRTSGEKGTTPVVSLLADTQAVVRLAAAEKLGDAPPTARPAVVNALEQAIAYETEGHVKQIMLANLVKAGRSDAVAVLDRITQSDTKLQPDAQDYLSILRGGYVDWADISRLKGDMEESRGH